MARPQIKCPAGEIVHPVLSSNPADVQCRIQGGLRPAVSAPDPTGKRELAVCCDQYATCRIWLIQQEIDRGPSTKRQRDATLARPHDHVLSSPGAREVVRA